MARRSLPGFSLLPIMAEVFFYLGIRPLPLPEMKMRYFRAFQGSWAERGCFVGAGGGSGKWLDREMWLETFCLFV